MEKFDDGDNESGRESVEGDGGNEPDRDEDAANSKLADCEENEADGLMFGVLRVVLDANSSDGDEKNDDDDEAEEQEEDGEIDLMSAGTA